MKRDTNKEDLVLLNICWSYKQKLINKEQFINTIDNFKHSFEDLDKIQEEKLVKEVGRPKKIDDKEVIKKIIKLNREEVSSREISKILSDENGVNIHFNTIINLINSIEKKIEKKPEKKEQDGEEKYLKLIKEMSDIDLSNIEFQSSGNKTNEDDVPNGFEEGDDDEDKNI